MRRFLLNAAVLASTMVAGAVAPYPGVVTYTQPDGTKLNVMIEGNEFGQVYRLAETGQAMLPDQSGRLTKASSNQVMQMQQSIAQASMASRGVGLHSSYVSHTGSPDVLVVLVQFKDVKFTVSNPATYFNNWLNQADYTTDGNSGSVRDYFKAQSMGKFTPNFKVYGPVTLSSNRSTYASTANAYKMASEACKSLDSQIDFSKYDTDGDGYVDNVYVIFAGQGSNYGASNAPWPHNSECETGLLTKTTVDGKVLKHYSCTCEQGYTAGQPDGIGTFIHEFGHALGFPDFYNTNATGDDTPNFWSVMDRGNYLGYCKTPCGYSAYERHAMDWMDYTTLNDPATVRLRSLADNNFAVCIETGRSGDYYILENRPATGWDRGIYGGGMLIWHIDASDQSALSNNPNNDSSHLRVKLVRADNDDSSATVWGDSWPGSSNKTSFTSSTTPAMVRWNASTGSGTTAVDKPVTNITNANNLVTFDYRGGSTTNIVDPVAEMLTVTVNATTGGTACINNQSGTTSYTAEAGTNVTLNATVQSGYRFTGWRFNGSIVSTEMNYTVSLSSATAGAYTATFAAASTELYVQVEATEGGSACINGDPDITYLVGTSGQRIMLNATRRSGYDFEGWRFNGEIVSRYTSTEINLSASTSGTYTAVFTPLEKQKYTATVNAEEGGTAYFGNDPTATTITVEEGTQVSMTAVAQRGYEFTGWKVAGSFVFTTENPYTFTMSAINAGTFIATFNQVEVPEYPAYEGNSTYAGSVRGVQTLTVSDNHGNSLTVDGPGNANGHAVYVDRTENVLTTEAGATLIVTGTAANTEWMHSYIYIDFDRDGQFDVDPTNTGVHQDLVAHTGYKITKHAEKNDTADPTVKSDGSTVNNGDFFEIPYIILPDNMADGVYRLRYKNDWNSIDPFGRTPETLSGLQQGNYIYNNGGSIIDITLHVGNVAGIGELSSDDVDAPARYFNLMGMPVNSDNLTSGFYIMVKGGKSTKVYIVR